MNNQLTSRGHDTVKRHSNITSQPNFRTETMNLSHSCAADAKNQVSINPNVASLAGQASAAAYSDYRQSHESSDTPKSIHIGSQSYDFVTRFTGFDAVAWGTGVEERFGIIYQSTRDKASYLFAFRGTSSVYDMWEDLDSAGTTEFRPHTAPTDFPNKVNVGAGFNRIYSSNSMAMAASMQQQLFDVIDNLPDAPQTILITGHSLGSALASLFALDLSISRPDIDLTNMNFASPRVGAQVWQDFYDNKYGLKEKTIRIRNRYDLIPKVPFEFEPFGFKHIGIEFQVSFTLDSYRHDPVIIIEAWHSISNYRYVVDRATIRSPEVWIGGFFDQTESHTLWPMSSDNPHEHRLDWEHGNLMKVRNDLQAVAAFM